MEVGHQPVDHPELETGMNEERRKGSTGRKGSSAPDRCVFERARGRGSHSDHAPVLLSRDIDRSGGRVADLVGLRIHHVILDVLHAHRLNVPYPDVERDGRALDAASGQVVEHFRREV